MVINALDLHFSVLNSLIKESNESEIVLDNVMGHRYIGGGTNGKNIVINGIPGNALGAYLDGSYIRVNGNAQDATGDTMNCGTIVIEGSSGDATGYAMRGGKIFIKGEAGYRAGIHMKAYKELKPILIIGEKAGDFLGEYQAGGIIAVLGIDCEGLPVGNYCGTGMHGGMIFIKSDIEPEDLPVQVICRKATKEDFENVESHIEEYCKELNVENIFKAEQFFVLIPNTENSYKQLYTHN